VKNTNAKDLKNLEANKETQHNHYRGITIRINTDFSSQKLQVSKQ
jgi:hypothetical protein